MRPSNLIADVPAMANMQAAQFLMVGGFVMLAWVLVRRRIRTGKRFHQETRAANKVIKGMRHRKEPSIPLSDAPAETQRWQAAMFDLQRELKAEMDTRIMVVQTLLNQADDRIAKLNGVQAGLTQPSKPESSLRLQIRELLNRGHNAREIATPMGLPLGDVELTIASL
jgi:hypothetical protein